MVGFYVSERCPCGHCTTVNVTSIMVPAVGSVVAGGEAWPMVLHHARKFIHILPSLQSDSDSSHFVTRVVARGRGAVGVEVKGHWEGNVSADFVSDFTTPPAWCTYSGDRLIRRAMKISGVSLGLGFNDHKTVLGEEKVPSLDVSSLQVSWLVGHAGSETSPT